MTTQRKAMQMALDALQSGILELNYVDKPLACIPLHEAIIALRVALVEPVVESVAWQPIATAPKGRIVLVHYKNRLGNGRTMRARYYLPETLESDTTESGWADEGWYEESEAYEYLMPLDDDPTHWMPVPLLSDDEIRKLADKADDGQEPFEFTLAFARAIEQAVRQKAGLR